MKDQSFEVEKFKCDNTSKGAPFLMDGVSHDHGRLQTGTSSVDYKMRLAIEGNSCSVGLSSEVAIGLVNVQGSVKHQ